MNFKLQSERLHLTPFSQNDQKVLHSIFTNEHVREFLWDDEVIPESQTSEILSINETQFKKERCGLWKVQLRSDKETVCGFAGLWYFFEEPQPQLIYGLLPDFTGLGLATESSKTIIDYAYNTLGFQYLMAATDKPHKQSIKVLVKCGFKQTTERMIEGKPTLFFKHVRL